MKINWLDLTSGEIVDNDVVVALVEYEDDGYTASIVTADDDLWFSALCGSEKEVIAEVEEYLQGA